MNNLTLEKFAKKYYMNSAYLGQLFIKKHKITFHEYLTAYRMETAAQLLSHTDYSVQEISKMVGIASVPYFNRVFRKAFNCTPLQYHKNFRSTL